MIAAFSVEFITFEHINRSKSLEQAMQGKVTGLPSEIMGLTPKSVRNATKNLGQKPFSIDVYKVRFSDILCAEHDEWLQPTPNTCKDVEGNLGRVGSRWPMKLLTVAEENHAPSSDGCFFVELSISLSPPYINGHTGTDN